ncbi:MAG: hypothetical protein AABY22_06960 [Nanoarchaeota archaeon]
MNKSNFIVFLTLINILIFLQFSSSVSVGTGVNSELEIEETISPPEIILCGNISMFDDYTEPWRNAGRNGNEPLVERINHNAFEGEQFIFTALITDEDGINNVKDVYVTVGDSPIQGNELEVNCNTDELSIINETIIDPSCNLDEDSDFEINDSLDSETQDYYLCVFTVETPESLYGLKYIGAEATDYNNLVDYIQIDQTPWYLNPIIALSVEGDIDFDNAKAGRDSYSPKITITNMADEGSGVIMDMFLSGTDFYNITEITDSCPTNLKLENFRYFAENLMNGYTSRDDLLIDTINENTILRDKDNEDYISIDYGIGFNNPEPFYENTEVIQAEPNIFNTGYGYNANILYPGEKMEVKFKFRTPSECRNSGRYNGLFYFWGENI